MKPHFLTECLDLISPRACAVCGHRLTAAEDTLCIACLTDLPYADFGGNYTDNTMARLFWGLFPIERAATLFYYQAQSPPFRLIHAMKYHDSPGIGITLGKMTAERCLPQHFFDGIDAIVPVPLTRLRRWQRGYNQSEAIAQGISMATALPLWKKVVKRTSFTDSQTRKHLAERKANVAHAFLLQAPDQIRGRHLLLVDDIVTTGATVTACAQELCRAEGVRISVMTIGLTK